MNDKPGEVSEKGMCKHMRTYVCMCIHVTRPETLEKENICYAPRIMDTSGLTRSYMTRSNLAHAVSLGQLIPGWAGCGTLRGVRNPNRVRRGKYLVEAR